MKYFGENWGAPICKTVEQAPIPNPTIVCECGHDIREGDIGVLIPFMGYVPDTGIPANQVTIINGIPHIGYHLVCFLDSLGIGKGWKGVD